MASFPIVKLSISGKNYFLERYPNSLSELRMLMISKIKQSLGSRMDETVEQAKYIYTYFDSHSDTIELSDDSDLKALQSSTSDKVVKIVATKVKNGTPNKAANKAPMSFDLRGFLDYMS